VLALAGVPLLVLVKDDQHPYQFYKLLQAVSPLLVLGLALLGREVAGRLTARPRWAALGSLVLPAAVLLVCGTASVRMLLGPAQSELQPRSFAYELQGPDLRHLQHQLEATRGRDLILAQRHNLFNSWLIYFARRHRLHLLDTAYFNEAQQIEMRPKRIWDTSRLPAAPAVLTRLKGAFVRIDPGDMRLTWEGEWFQLWDARSRRWALPVSLDNANGVEALGGLSYLWVGGPATRLEILAGAPGHVTLTAALRPGPSVRGRPTRRLRLQSPDGKVQELTASAGTFSLAVPVKEGLNAVTLQALDAPEPGAVSGDPRPLVLGVWGLSMSYAPGRSDRPPTGLAGQGVPPSGEAPEEF
jgi:hypothetical protein